MRASRRPRARAAVRSVDCVVVGLGAMGAATARALSRRGLRVDWVGVYEPNDGVLRPEAAIRAMLATALKHGATLVANEPVTAWDSDGEGVRVTTAHRTVRAASCVLAAGPWMPRLLPALP